VTGAAGFVGTHLVRQLLAAGEPVIGVYKPGTTPGAEPAVDWRAVDLLDGVAVRALVAAVRPTQVYHLAGQPSVARSWRDPAGTFRANVETTVLLLDALLTAGLTPVVLVVGSNEMFGLTRPEEQPLGEDAPFRPLNPYATSKVAQEFVALQYGASHGLPAVRVRPFMHIGPGQRPDFAVASFARQIAAIEAGHQPPVVRVGNLAAERDVTDVRDIVRGYHVLATRGRPGEAYNLGRGQAYRIGDLLEMLLSLAYCSITVEVDPALLRPADTPVVLCNPRKVQRETGWHPEIPIEQTLRDTLDYWRQQFRLSEQQ
jgi:GDP-4-dehydro-6-deoxy-D-mannose reductase